MNALKVYFEIAEDINCPLYEQGELMQLTDKTFACPAGKEACLILVRDMTQLLFTLLGNKGGSGEISDKLNSCSGCTGLIKFRQIAEPEHEPVKDEADAGSSIETVLQEIHGLSVDSPLLQAIPNEKIRLVLDSFEELSISADTVLVQHGEQNPNLYLIVSGEFVVETRGERIATLIAGEIFGEMSYLSAGTAIATVRAVKDSKVLAVKAKVFYEMLDNEPKVQSFMARLLADRLKKINQARARDFESCMTGKLDEVLPAELFQVFHMHQKTGVLSMQLEAGEARVSFREGCIINASYGDKESQEAIFAILAEKKGYYRFITGLSAKEMRAAEIGDFMALLMEGIKRVDEGGE